MSKQVRRPTRTSSTWPRDFPEPVRAAWKHGLHVIPRPTDSKGWIDWKKYQDRRPSRAEVIAWHQEDPETMWQFLCGEPGYIVLDFDNKNGHRGTDTMARLGLLPTILTPSGGAHVYVEPPGHPVRSRTPVDPRRWPGLDLLGERHLATFYGQRFDGQYRPSRERKVYTVGELPPDLQELFKPEAQKPRTETLTVRMPEGFADFVPARRLLQEALRRVQDGHGRHNSCLWLGQRLRDERVPEDKAQRILFRFADAVQRVGEGDLFTRHEAYSIWQWVSAQPPRPPSRLWMLAYKDTDGGNAQRLVALHGEDLRYVVPKKQWYAWDGQRWSEDDTLEVERRAKDVVQRMYDDAAQLSEDDEHRKRLGNWATRSHSRARIEAMVALARSEPQIPVRPDQLDPDSWQFNVRNGTLDLRTGALRPHRRADLITKLAPVDFDPEAQCPRWDAFLERIVPDEDDRAFLQRAVGYSLTGDTREEVLFILDGTGANGKSTFLETIRTLLGDYAQAAPEELLEGTRRGGASPEEARLPGKRFVTAIETAEGGRLREASIKQLVSGERRAARDLYQSYFEFAPTAKFWIATNHLPIIRGTDEAIWRRIRRVRFEVYIPKQQRDPHLKVRLRRSAELSGILNWALAGLRTWRESGLGRTRNIAQATKQYRTEQDVFGAFLDDECVVGDRERVTSDVIFTSYTSWCHQNNYRPMSKVGFGRKLGDRGFRRVRIGHDKERGWAGVTVRLLSGETE